MSRVPAWVATVIIVREIAVSVLRIVGVSQGVSIPADRYGKIKTLLQIVSIVYVLVPTADVADGWTATVGARPRRRLPRHDRGGPHALLRRPLLLERARRPPHPRHVLMTALPAPPWCSAAASCWTGARATPTAPS